MRTHFISRSQAKQIAYSIEENYDYTCSNEWRGKTSVFSLVCLKICLCIFMRTLRCVRVYTHHFTVAKIVSCQSGTFSVMVYISWSCHRWNCNRLKNERFTATRHEDLKLEWQTWLILCWFWWIDLVLSWLALFIMRARFAHDAKPRKSKTYHKTIGNGSENNEEKN